MHVHVHMNGMGWWCWQNALLVLLLVQQLVLRRYPGGYPAGVRLLVLQLQGVAARNIVGYNQMHPISFTCALPVSLSRQQNGVAPTMI